MASGNFLIGRSLSLAGFNHYVLPLLKQRKAELSDILVFQDKHDHKILASLSGDDLERAVDISLVEAGKQAEEDQNTKPECSPNSSDYAEYRSWSYQLKTVEWAGQGKDAKKSDKGVYEVIGIYRHARTASRLFPVIAQKYLADSASESLDDLEKKAKKLMGKRLGEL
ncbi:MAG: hypothetical protein KKB21_00255 [Nanoarchaeota archaeon]|nr:hypothetical protein [Nanoarchaeota archaeon]MBU4085990.1 hypothetical protein [Nanoarchaeota archaeon]